MSERETAAGKQKAPAMDVDEHPPSKKMKTEEGEVPTARADGGDGGKGSVEGDVEEEEGDNPYGHLGRVREKDVGITEFISQNRGISAVIKQRYSDFIVNEVSNIGQIVHLTDLKAPVIKEPLPETEPCGPVDDVITEELLGQLKLVAAGSIPHTSVPAGEDKTWRLRLHRAVKMSFPSLETKTEDREGAKVITATLRGKAKGRDTRGENERYEWPQKHRDDKYCRFTMYKENKNTSDVIHLLARFLKVKENLFGFAGTKDRRAKTTQEITAFKIHPTRLENLNKFLRNIMLGNFSYSEKPLKLGDLSGNHFTIVLRNVKGEDEDLEACLTSLKNVGFINYYGLQRFGAQNCATHEIGRAILKDDWEEAVNMILSGATPATNTTSDTADTTSTDTATATATTGGTITDADSTNNTGDAKMDTDTTTTDTDAKMSDTTASGKFVKGEHSKVWRETRDASLTLQKLRPFNHIERKLCNSLIKKPNDFLGALQTLYRNTRMLYPHSYQSYVWNIMASRRVRTYGLKPVVGDLVLPPGSAIPADEERAVPTEPEDGEGGKQEEKRGKIRVQPTVLDKTNVSQYSIYDVVLPLPGYDVIYPNNEVHSWYKEMLAKDGLDIDNMRRKQKDYSLPGSYRYMVIQPRDMSWEVLRYDDVKEALALSDADVLNGVDKPQSLPEGKQKAVRVSFTLGLSAYATMALREVLKQDTSAAHQASLNDA